MRVHNYQKFLLMSTTLYNLFWSNWLGLINLLIRNPNIIFVRAHEVCLNYLWHVLCWYLYWNISSPNIWFNYGNILFMVFNQWINWSYSNWLVVNFGVFIPLILGYFVEDFVYKKSLMRCFSSKERKIIIFLICVRSS